MNPRLTMGFNPKAAWSLVKETVEDWDSDNASSLAAALACYTLLSIAPLMVMAVSIGGMLFGREAARGQIAAEMGSIVGADAAHAIQSIAANAKDPAPGIISTVIGGVVLLLGASGVFVELHSTLNRIWDVQPKPGRGIVGFLRDRLFSFAMVMAVAFLLLVSLILSAGLSAAGHFFEQSLPGGELIWEVINFVVSLGVTTLLFALIYKYVPDAVIRWRDVWLGAFVTALLFSVGKLLLGLYIGKSSFASSFGAAGSLVALVVWVYYSSQIIFSARSSRRPGHAAQGGASSRARTPWQFPKRARRKRPRPPGKRIDRREDA
ncbi:MAG: YihY/virulence factor BrkB family protein [Polyangiaceae bacterium]